MQQEAVSSITKLRELKERIQYLRKALRLASDAAPVWTVLWLVLTLLRGLLPVGVVYLTKFLVDNIAAVMSAGVSWESIQPVLLPGALMGLVLILMQSFDVALTWVRTAQAELIEDHIKALVHRQASSVDLAFYETPDLLDKMQRANSEASRRSLSVLQSIGGVMGSAVTLIGVAALLVTYSLWLPVVLILSTLPALGIVLHHHRLHHNWWKGTTAERRWTEYYDRLLTFAEAAAELRLLEMQEYFQDRYQSLRGDLRRSRLQLLKNQNLAQLGAAAVALVITGATMIWMVLRAMRGLATLGDLALFYQAFNQGQALMRSLLGNVGQLYADTLFLEHLFSFLELRPEITTPELPAASQLRLGNGIELKNISFRYPESEQLALENFSLSIPAGKVVAIVGPNGAGKSTLIKLLCRFYDPERGRVEIDGTDIRDLPLEEVRRLYTVMFQHPVRYVATVAENIAFGDAYTDLSMPRVIEAAQEGGADDFISRLSKGYDTLLSKLFSEGTELSGGQKQRIALARAMYRKAQVVILDEPTSFMDSWAEIDWLDRFYSYNARLGGTAIVITHRFTTAMRADIIYVMEDGRVVEQGTHSELVKQGGMYAKSWNSQVQSESLFPMAI